jgi:hypothetical protein
MWAYACDQFHLLLLGHEMANEYLRIFATDPRVRFNMGKDLPSRQTMAYDRIRTFHSDAGYDDAALFGSWKDVPIMCVELQSFKRGGVSLSGGTKRACRHSLLGDDFDVYEWVDLGWLVSVIIVSL